MKKSYFEARKQEKVFCPNCGKEMYRLADAERDDGPRFNICFSCKFIGHIGVGIVEVKE